MISPSLSVKGVALQRFHSFCNHKPCFPPNPPFGYFIHKSRHHLLQSNLPRQATASVMADDAMKKQQQQDPLIEKIEEDKAKEVVPSPTPPSQPPPPEKPLPGDCCGSGCVRCVWDIYYEELEEYNNLYGKPPQSK